MTLFFWSLSTDYRSGDGCSLTSEETDLPANWALALIVFSMLSVLPAAVSVLKLIWAWQRLGSTSICFSLLYCSLHCYFWLLTEEEGLNPSAHCSLRWHSAGVSSCSAMALWPINYIEKVLVNLLNGARKTFQNLILILVTMMVCRDLYCNLLLQLKQASFTIALKSFLLCYLHQDCAGCRWYGGYCGVGLWNSKVL